MPYDTVVDKAKLERAITATADAIRAKTGDTAPLKWDAEKGLSDAVSNLSTGVEGGIDTSDATATAEDMAKGVTAYANGEKVTGSVDVVGNLVAVNFNGVTIAEKNEYIDIYESVGSPKLLRNGAVVHTLASKSSFGKPDVYFGLNTVPGNGAHTKEEKQMKKLTAIALTLLLILALAVPASAVTTMRWDWGKARESIGNAAAQIVQEQTEPTEALETEYIPAGEPEPYTETEPEPVAETTHERIQSWRDWREN